jgi:hypothetical protein
MRMRRFGRIVPVRAQIRRQVVIPTFELEVQLGHERLALLRRLGHARRIHFAEDSSRKEHESTRPGECGRAVQRRVVVELGGDGRDRRVDHVGSEVRSSTDVERRDAVGCERRPEAFGPTRRDGFGDHFGGQLRQSVRAEVETKVCESNVTRSASVQGELGDFTSG